MNKNIILIGLLLFVGIIMPAAFAITPNYLSYTNNTPLIKATQQTSPQICGDHICMLGENPSFWNLYLQNVKNNPHAQKPISSMALNAYAPDGTCNISGIIDAPTGKCSVGAMVLSPDDYVSLTTDPAILAVPASQTIATQAVSTTTFCQIANWIIDHEDGYSTYIANQTNLIDPPYCRAQHVPELGQLAAVVLAISIMAVVLLSIKTGIRFTPKHYK